MTVGEGGVDTGSTRWSSLKGPEKATVNHTNNNFKGNAGGDFWKTESSAYEVFRTHRYTLELNQTEDKYFRQAKLKDGPRSHLRASRHRLNHRLHWYDCWSLSQDMEPKFPQGMNDVFTINRSVNQSISQSVYLSIYLHCHMSSKIYKHKEWGMVLRAFITIHTYVYTPQIVPVCSVNSCRLPKITDTNRPSK